MKAGVIASIVTLGLIKLDEPMIIARPAGPMTLPIPPKPYADPMPVARRLDGQTSAAYGPITGQPPLPMVWIRINNSQNTEIDPIMALGNRPARTVAATAPNPTIPA